MVTRNWGLELQDQTTMAVRERSEVEVFRILGYLRIITSRCK